MSTLRIRGKVDYLPLSLQPEGTDWLDKEIALTSDLHITNVQSIGTSEEALVLGDVVTPGFIFVENLDVTNYVEIGLTGSYTVKLKAREWAIFRLAGAPYALANTADVIIKYTIYDGA